MATTSSTRRRPERPRSGRSSTRSSPHPSTSSTPPRLQAQIAVVTPQVNRLQGWLSAAAGRLDAPDGRERARMPTPAGLVRSLAGSPRCSTTRPASAGSQLRTARLLRELPLVVDAVLDGVLTPQQAAVLTRMVGKIDADWARRVATPSHPGRRGDGPAPARDVGRAPDRHPLRTRPRRRRRTGPGQAVPHPPPRGRRRTVRTVPDHRRRQRSPAHRPRTAGPQGRRRRHPHRRATPRRRARRARRAGPAPRRPCPTPAGYGRS